MNTPTFSLLHATYGRPAKAIAAMRMMMKRAAKPDSVEYIFACNEDDPACDEFNELGFRCAEEMKINPIVTVANFPSSAPAWDAAAKVSTGGIMIQMSDDMEFPPRWDELILDAVYLQKWGADWKRQPFVVAPGEHYRKDALLTCAICNRARYNYEGHFIFPGYRSVFSDDDFSIRAYGDECDGLCNIVRAPEIVLRHEHAYHNPAVPHDATYARQNSPEAYAQGGALFVQRNAALVARGFKTW